MTVGNILRTRSLRFIFARRAIGDGCGLRFENGQKGARGINVIAVKINRRRVGIDHLRRPANDYCK